MNDADFKVMNDHVRSRIRQASRWQNATRAWSTGFVFVLVALAMSPVPVPMFVIVFMAIGGLILTLAGSYRMAKIEKEMEEDDKPTPNK